MEHIIDALVATEYPFRSFVSMLKILFNLFEMIESMFIHDNIPNTISSNLLKEGLKRNWLMNH